MSEGDWKWKTQRRAHQGGRGEPLFIFSSSTKTKVYLPLCSKVRKSDKLGHNKINILWKVMVLLFCVALLLLVCFSVLKRENQGFFYLKYIGLTCILYCFGIDFFFKFFFSRMHQIIYFLCVKVSGWKGKRQKINLKNFRLSKLSFRVIFSAVPAYNQLFLIKEQKKF